MRKTLLLIKLRFVRNLWVILGIASLATAGAIVWWETDFLGISGSERGAYDDGLGKFTGHPDFPWKYAPGGEVKRSKDIVIVGITDSTFASINQHEPWRQRYGSFPYDRVLWADLFGYLKEVGAKGIVFDAVMDESKSDILGDIALGKQIETDQIPVYLGFGMLSGATPLPRQEIPFNRAPPGKPEPAPEKLPGGEAAPGDPFAEDTFPEEPTPEEAARATQARLVELRVKAARAYAFPVEAKGGLKVPRFEEGPVGPQYPLPAIEQVIDVIAGFGTVDHEPDGDGKMRFTRFVYSDGVNDYVTLPVAVAADHYGAEKVELSPGLLKLGKKEIRINPEGDAEIDYGGTLYKKFDTIPVDDVLRYKNGVDGGVERFKDKYVFIAGLATGTGDIKGTPLEANTPGVAKQAAILQNLLDGQFILRAPFWVSLLLALLLATFSASLVLVVRNTFVDIGWPVALYIGFFLLTGGFLVATKIHILSALPGLAGTLASVLATSWEKLFADKERARMKAAFQHFMESDLVDQMIEQKKLPKLEGENLLITAFFSDLKGFTAFTDKYQGDPHALMRLLNRYLSAVTPSITVQGACIDKYIGDKVLALFGAPNFFADHALRACKAALSVQKSVATLRESFRSEGLPDVYTRIGLNTGTMLVGNIGSQQLMDYTAIGDEVRLAETLEEANKVFGTLILIGAGTYEQVREHVEARELDHVRVEGSAHPTTVYELLALRGELHFDKAKVVELYGQALMLYRARKFEEAQRRLTAALGVDQSDGPSQRLLALCQRYLTAPPPASWDAVSPLEK
ncbi:MAG: adenylate cyclase [Myxococcaceae bacterium]|nr:adenylate cyclase [Myxococcaceae bacterium]